MELKDYQIKVLDYLETYLEILSEQKQEKIDYYEFQKSKGKENIPNPEKSDFCTLAWNALKARKSIYSPDYQERSDGMGRKIPNICFKVPTGGGKTLLASAALERINQDYFKRNNGFVIWVVPSETIYTQTSKQLRNREHPYRQILDRASGGKTKILEKGDLFNVRDIQDNLCIMLLMLQSGNRENKESLKMFKDSGGFESFFPPIDDYIANKALWDTINNIERNDLTDANVISGLSIKHSLGNVMRILRPIVIFDEGHRGASVLAQQTINGLNPSFILELSATPKQNSNVIVNVGGKDLKNEKMIKLPINVVSYEQENWQYTLSQAHEKLSELNKDAEKYQSDSGKYIRPIMLIKAEPQKKDDNYDHVAAIKAYLQTNLQVSESEIRIKLAGKNELKDDDLFDKHCPVKYIITKDALKEGWDCSFAYILTILTNSQNEGALTQFVGRVLRQPHASETPYSSLNECYVYCNHTNVNEAVNGIKNGLEGEGMGDVANQIVSGAANADNKVRATLKRNDKFKEAKIFLPKLNCLVDGKPKPFDYYADILSKVNWDAYKFDSVINLQNNDEIVARNVQVNVNEGDTQQFDFQYSVATYTKSVSEINISLMVSQLMEKVQNAWQAYRIINEVLSQLKSQNIPDSMIAFNSVFIIDLIKKNAFKWLLEESETIFKSELEKGNIFLQLLAEPFTNMNWQMAVDIDVWHNANEAPIELAKNLFQPQYQSNYNGLEIDVSLAINNSKVVEWWHRLAVKGTEYSVQGWRKDKIYPDFLVKLEGNRVYFIETKGNHLEGNEDTTYKQKLFETLNSVLENCSKPIGELEVLAANEHIKFDMVFENEWQNSLNAILK